MSRSPNVLVTGGAGYIGSVIVSRLIKDGFSVIVLDNLKSGHRDAVHPRATFIKADICDEKAIVGVFNQHNIEYVMHMAAETLVSASMTDPQKYFATNVTGSLNVLDVMLQNGVKKFIFSSSAAVYGEPQSSPIEENHPTVPINGYGESKLIIEKILKWYQRAYSLQFIALRYFCAAGATELFGEDHDPETHLIPNVLKAARNGSVPLSVYGNDYPTPDGSCVRDFVHVADIADAHILALKNLGEIGAGVYNLGNSRGYSVFEVIKMAEAVTGVNIPANITARRTGDPVSLIANAEKARQELGWKPILSELEAIVGSAWQWAQSHPAGYSSSM